MWKYLPAGLPWTKILDTWMFQHNPVTMAVHHKGGLLEKNLCFPCHIYYVHWIALELISV